MPSIHRWSGDLVALLGFTFFATALNLDRSLGASPLRLLVLPVILFAPGYALVSLLFPEEPDPEADDGAPGLGIVERLALAVALSVGIVPTVALVLNFTSYGIRPGPVLVVVAGFVAVCSVLALVARFRVPTDRRFGMGPVDWVAEVNSRSFSTDDRSLHDRGLFDARTNSQRLLNVAIVASVLLFGASLAFAGMVPTSPAADEAFTEFYVVGENESGELTAGSVPREFQSGESRPVTVGVENREGKPVAYTVVTQVQRASVDGSEVRVSESTEIDRFTMEVGAGETERVQREVRPALDGDRLRVVFLLYRGEPPADPSVENAYRSTRVWITVGGSS